MRIGINPKSRFVGYEGIDSMVVGAVSIGLGDNKSIVGKNDSDFMWSSTMTKATIEAYGERILTEGRLQI